MPFVKATKQQAKLRLALMGPAGSGKTFTALRLAAAMGGRVAVIDTEFGAAAKYSDLFDFDVCELPTGHPQRYLDEIEAAERAGYDTLIVDSYSNAWSGKEGALELVDIGAGPGGNKFAGWMRVTPLINHLLDRLMGCRMHTIVTLKVKTDHQAVINPGTGRMEVMRLGLAPIQRDGVEYAFDILGSLDQANNLTVIKSRCPNLQGSAFPQPGEDLAAVLKAWLSDGRPVWSLDELVERFGAEAVMSAGGGTLPATAAEVAVIAAKLQPAGT